MCESGNEVKKKILLSYGEFKWEGDWDKNCDGKSEGKWERK